jgi:undecaprenyl-diphosphatase
MTTPTSIQPPPSDPQFFQVRDAISTRRLVITTGVAVTVVLACSVVAWNGDVPEWEADLLRFFNDWPDWLESILWALQQVGVLAGPLIGGLVIVWFTRRWEYLLPFVLLIPLKLVIEKAMLKQIVQRERPYVSVGPDITVRGPAFEGLSYPSGHATTAFAFAILVVAFLPRRWRPIPLIWAMIVGIARMYFGEHNVLDVVAGMAMGTMFGTILWFATLNRFVDVTDEARAS